MTQRPFEWSRDASMMKLVQVPSIYALRRMKSMNQHHVGRDIDGIHH